MLLMAVTRLKAENPLNQDVRLKFVYLDNHAHILSPFIYGYCYIRLGNKCGVNRVVKLKVVACDEVIIHMKDALRFMCFVKSYDSSFYLP